MFQNIDSIGLSLTGPTILVLQIAMSGDGSSGSATFASARRSSAFLPASFRALSSRLVSTVSINGSAAGTLAKLQLLPLFPLLSVGMFFVQRMSHSPGDTDVRLCDSSIIW